MLHPGFVYAYVHVPSALPPQERRDDWNIKEREERDNGDEATMTHVREGERERGGKIDIFLTSTGD